MEAEDGHLIAILKGDETVPVTEVIVTWEKKEKTFQLLAAPAPAEAPAPATAAASTDEDKSDDAYDIVVIGGGPANSSGYQSSL